MRKKITNEIIDLRLLKDNRPIKRLGNYISAITKINWQCLNINCNNIWSGTPNTIINNKTGCAKCAGNAKLNNFIVDERLKNSPIKRIGNFVNTNTSIEFECIICNYSWKAKPQSIFSGNGCSRCSKVIKYTNKIIDTKLVDLQYPIKRLGECAGANNHILLECLICSHTWSARLAHIFNSKSSCPICNTPGKNEKLMHSILSKHNINYVLQYCIKNIDSTSPAYRFDAYLPNIKVAIEYNGKRHYSPTGFGSLSPESHFEKQKMRDNFVRDFCIKNDIELIEIDGRSYNGKKLYKYLEEKLIVYLQRKLNE